MCVCSHIPGSGFLIGLFNFIFLYHISFSRENPYIYFIFEYFPFHCHSIPSLNMVFIIFPFSRARTELCERKVILPHNVLITKDNSLLMCFFSMQQCTQRVNKHRGQHLAVLICLFIITPQNMAQIFSQLHISPALGKYHDRLLSGT